VYSVRGSILPDAAVFTDCSASGRGLLVHWPWHATPSSMAEASELLKHRRLRDHRGHLLRCFSLAFLVGGALTRGDLVEGAPFRFHSHMGVAREHGPRDVPGDAHDDLITGTRLSEFGYQRVPVGAWAFDDRWSSGGAAEEMRARTDSVKRSLGCATNISFLRTQRSDVQ
jgi:hypothetical protein